MIQRNAVALGSAVSLAIAGALSWLAARRARHVEPAHFAIASQAASDGGTPERRPADGKVAPGAPSMLHLDPRHTNRSPFAGPASPNVAWTFDTGGPIEAAPAV